MKQTSLLKSICALLQKGWGESFCSSSSFFFFHVKYVVQTVERASLIAQLVKNPPAIQETPVQFLGGKIRWRRRYRLPTPVLLGFPHGSAGKESTCYVGDLGLIPGLGRSPGEEKGYPLQYSGLENSMDCIVHGVTRSRTWLSDFHFHCWKFSFVELSFTIPMIFTCMLQKQILNNFLHYFTFLRVPVKEEALSDCSSLYSQSPTQCPDITGT